MSCKIKFTKAAAEDLRSIARYILESSKDNAIAISFVKELREKCTILKDFPKIGAFPKDRILGSLGYRFLVHKDYLIFYLHEEPENTVYIMAVFNSKRDYMKVMQKFL